MMIATARMEDKSNVPTNWSFRSTIHRDHCESIIASCSSKKLSKEQIAEKYPQSRTVEVKAMNDACRIDESLVHTIFS